MCAINPVRRVQKPSMLTTTIGLRVLAELRPGHLLDQFLQRADAAGQGDEGIGALEHQALALMHVGGDDRSSTSSSMRSRRFRKSGMMPVTAAAVLDHGAGHRAHQADVAAAIDEADALGGHRGTKVLRSLGIGRASRRCRSHNRRKSR